MRVFISQPMNDKTDEEIEMERAMALAKMKKEYPEPIHIIDSFLKMLQTMQNLFGISAKLMLYISARVGNGIEVVLLSMDVHICITQ